MRSDQGECKSHGEHILEDRIHSDPCEELELCPTLDLTYVGARFMMDGEVVYLPE